MGRVEKERGTETYWRSARFPFPLIKPDVPISSIRLPDGLHVQPTSGASARLQPHDAEFSVYDLRGKPARPTTPIALMPPPQKVPHAIIHVSVDLPGKPMGGSARPVEPEVEGMESVLQLWEPAQGLPYTTTLRELTASIEKRVRWNRHWVRALHPFESGDLALLEAVNRGEFTINDLRNRDLQALLFSTMPTTQAEARRRSAAIRRKLRLLRAHGIIHKLPHTHRYQFTDQGRLILNAVLSAQRTTTQQLTTLAA